MTYGGSFDLESKEAALVGLEQRMASPGFWDQPDAAREVIEQANRLKAWTEPWSSLTQRVEELTELADLLAEEEDEDLSAELDRETASIGEGLAELELRNMLGGRTLTGQPCSPCTRAPEAPSRRTGPRCC